MRLNASNGWFASHSPWHLVAGFTLWSLWFVAAYGGLSIGCAMATPDAARGPYTALNGGLIALTALTVAVLLAAAWACLQGLRATHAPGQRGLQGAERRRFTAGLSALLYLSAAFATVFVGLALVWLPPCL